jgi:PAS domain S-box-containing protein
MGRSLSANSLGFDALGRALLESAEAAGFGVIVNQVTAPVGRNLYVSDRAAEIFRRSVAELLDDPWCNVAPEERERLASRFRARLAGEKSPTRYQYIAVDPNGNRFPVEIYVSYVTVDGRNLTITFISKPDSDRQRLQELLRQNDRLTALGTLAAGVAHEINNPLAYVLLNLGWLERRLSDAARSPESLASIVEMVRETRTGAERVAAIVRELRAFSRSEPETRLRQEIHEAVTAAARMLAHELRERARLFIDRDDAPAVLAGPGQLEQVLLNLILNASQAFADNDPDRNEIRVRIAANEAGDAIIEVTDNGVGMEESVVARIFDPFFTTKPLGVGTGLGLSICHGIVTALGGRITVSSEPGRGSTFRIALPPAPPHETSVPPTSGVSDSGTRGQRRARVLVVDDEAPILGALRELLSAEHDVVLANDAEQARRAIDAGGDFDIVLCDLVMPGASGMDLYTQISVGKPALAARFVFMTGGGFTTRAADFLANVPNRRIDKPFNLATVERIVRDAAEKRGSIENGVATDHDLDVGVG